MSFRARSELRALNSEGVRLDCLLGRNLVRRSMSCRHCRMNSSRDPTGHLVDTKADSLKNVLVEGWL